MKQEGMKQKGKGIKTAERKVPKAHKPNIKSASKARDGGLKAGDDTCSI
jgi:hypothetical protein